MSFDLPQRLRKRNHWFRLRPTHEPVLCARCGKMGHPDDMLFVLLITGGTGVYHAGCAPLDSKVLT